MIKGGTSTGRIPAKLFVAARHELRCYHVVVSHTSQRPLVLGVIVCATPPKKSRNIRFKGVGKQVANEKASFYSRAFGAAVPELLSGSSGRRSARNHL